MNKTYLLALAASLVAAPAALAHDPPGTLKNYCEDPNEWGVHDYAPPADGTLIALGSDGNLAGDCNGDGVPADFDGHVEWAVGGGWLDVDTGDGVTGGTLACYGVLGHHPFFGPISVVDTVLGITAPFSVTADTINLIPPTDPAEPNCGDFQADESTDCVGTCTVTFPPGLDGNYPIFVGDAETGIVGTAGHIETGVTPAPVLCGDDSLLILGASLDGGVTYNGAVALVFTVGANRQLAATDESVTQTGGPAGAPGLIVHQDVLGLHVWVVSPSADLNTRDYSYSFTTSCPGVGGTGVTAGTFRLFN